MGGHAVRIWIQDIHLIVVSVKYVLFRGLREHTVSPPDKDKLSHTGDNMY